MKKFIKHFFITVTIFWLVCTLITVVIYSSFKKDFYSKYELNELVIKQQVLAAYPSKINTVFIGASQVYRQIIPEIFDSLTNNSSFNMGYPALLPLRSYTSLTEVLKSEKGNSIKNIFIELAPPDRITHNYNNNPFVYETNFNNYKTVISTCTSPNLPAKYKISTFGYWNIALIYKYSGFSLSKFINLLTNTDPTIQTDDISNNEYRNLVTKTKGFVDLNTEESKLNNEEIKAHRKLFETQGGKIVNELKNNYYSYTNPKPEQVTLFTKYLINYANHLKQEGKNVYFIINPRDLFFIKYNLMQKKILIDHGFKVFDLSDPKLYPEFYQFENSYDRYHLNYKGAKLYTQALAKLYNSQ